MLVFLASLAALPPANAQTWEPGFGSPKPQGSIEDAIVYDSQLVGMYRYQDTNGIPEINGQALAIYDDGQWLPLLSVSTWEPGEKAIRLESGGLAIWNDDLVVGGEFVSLEGTPARNVGRFHAGTWQAIGGGVPRAVGALGEYNGELLAAPRSGAWPTGLNALFYTYEDTSWSAVELPPGYSWGRVDCFLEVDHILYLGGTFVPDGSNDQDVICVMKYDGLGITPVAGGIPNDTRRPIRRLPKALVGVHALKEFDGSLYAAGTFRQSGTGLEAMARLDGNQWVPIPIRGYLSDLVVYNDRLVPVGDYEVPNAWGAWRREFAGWDGRQWTLLEDLEHGRSQLDQVPLAAATWQDRFVVCGFANDKWLDQFELHTAILADFDGHAWRRTVSGADQQGVPGLTTSSCVFRGDWILGGRFEWAGPQPVANIARWDGTRWHGLGPGLYPASDCSYPLAPIHELTVYRDELYAGGVFRIGPDGPRTSLARWDGENWSDVGGGTHAAPAFNHRGVIDFATYDDNLVILGDFDTAGEQRSNGIALWDGDAWDLSVPGPDSTLAGELPALICAAELDGQLYVGGRFVYLGATRCDGLGRWDGRTWHRVNPQPGALVVKDMGVYEGKLHLFAGDMTAESEGGEPMTLRRVDADSIRTLTALPPGSKSSTLFMDDGIYMGGSYLARWNGEETEIILPRSGARPFIESMVPLDGSLAMGLDPNHSELCGAGILHLGADFMPTQMSVLGTRTGQSIRLTWRLAGLGSSFTIVLERRQVEGDWHELARWPAPVATRLGGWSDHAAALNSEVEYRLVAERDGEVVAMKSWVAAAAVDPETPLVTRILGSQPNPFNPSTTIRFAYDGTGPAVVRIYNMAGREVRSIDLGTRPAGVYEVQWRGTDDSGSPVGSGVYLVQMVGSSAQQVHKITLIK